MKAFLASRESLIIDPRIAGSGSCSAAIVLAASLLVASGINWANASVIETIVAPSGAATSEGNANNSFPFNISAANGITDMRYQQLYDASLFTGSRRGALLITQIIFRPNDFAFSSTLPDIQINLSTTNVADDSLSSTFAQNVGANDTVVFARGPLTLSSESAVMPLPAEFQIVIELTTPYIYKPTQGNLLLDVRNFGGGFTGVFDAEMTPGDGISRVLTDRNFPDGVNSTTGEGDTLGLVTAFTVRRGVGSGVPDGGSSGVLLGSALLLLSLFLPVRARARGTLIAVQFFKHRPPQI